MARTVYATVTDPTGDPRRSLPVFFHAPAGHESVTALTDDAGMFRAGLVPDVEYRVSVENAVIVDGVTFPAGTVLLVRVPDGEGDVPGVAALVGTIDGSRPALLDLIAEQQTQVDDLTARVAALEAPEPEGGS